MQSDMLAPEIRQSEVRIGWRSDVRDRRRLIKQAIGGVLDGLRFVLDSQALTGVLLHARQRLERGPREASRRCSEAPTLR